MLLIFSEEYYGNFRVVVRLYRDRYPNRHHPNDTVIRNCISRLRQGQICWIRIKQKIERNYRAHNFRRYFYRTHNKYSQNK